MEKRIVIALAACALLVAGLGWWAFDVESAPIPVPTELAPRESSLAEPQRTSLEPIAELREVESLGVAHSERPAENAQRELAPVDEADPSRCALVGRVVDGDGRPLAGLSLAFRAYGRWCDDAEADDTSWIRDGRYQGLDGSTDATGAFRVDAPVPTAEIVSLRLELDAHHTAETHYYGGTHSRSKRALGPGVNDLGTFALLRAGSVWGRVHAEDGTPLAGAKVKLGSSLATTIGVDCVSEDSGLYRIEHAPPGEHGIAVQLEGYVSRFESPVVIVAGMDVRGPDFVLARAPTLQGRVVDEHGRPLAGARLWCWPDLRSLGSGSGAGAESGPDGRFVIHLHHDVDHHSLEVTLDGHDPFTSGGTVYAPGTEGIEIVLPIAAEVVLLVVDRETKEPLEILDTFVVRDDARGWTSWTPYYQEHAGGRVRVEARPNVDQIRVAAPGYHEGFVGAAAGETTVELLRGPELRGRVLANGRPVPHPNIAVQEGSIDDDHGWSGNDATRAQHRGEADGSFHIGLSDYGTYRIEIHGASAVPLLLVPVEVPEEGMLDLGDLELPRGAAILGRVDLPAGVPLDGFEIHVPEISRHEAMALTDERGEFALENLPPGKRILRVTKEGVLSNDPRDSVEVDLADGERRSIVLAVDPTRLLCRLTVTVLSAGVPLQGLRVSLQSIAADEEWAGSLGETDERGVASGLVCVGMESRLVLSGSQRFELRPNLAPITLQFGSPLELVVELEVGRLELSWPAAPDFEPTAADTPDEEFAMLGQLDEILVGIGISRAGQSEQVRWMGLPETRESGGIVFHVVELGPLEPGSYVVRVMEARLADGDVGESGWSWPPSFRPQRISSAVVEAGQVAICRF